MIEVLEEILKKFNELEKKMVTTTDIKELTKITKEHSNLKETVETYLEYKAVLSDKEAVLLLSEEEGDEEILSEIGKLEEKEEELTKRLKVLLLPKDPNDDKNIIVDIKGATGGDEANIFAGDLFRMYSRYAERKGWKIEVLNSTVGTQGGFTNLEFMISGDKVYSLLKYESGVHRVQRVPETESQGRIHTSTATVLVLPEAEDIDVDVSWSDIRVDYYNSSGPGGQSVNTTKSAVRLTHNPSGLVVTCQDAKSQHENKDKAFIILKSRLYDKIAQEKAGAEGEIRRSLVGQGMRSEKIRTYNYPQNRVTDHRVPITLQRLDSIIEGNIDLIIEPLLSYYETKALEKENEGN